MHFIIQKELMTTSQWEMNIGFYALRNIHPHGPVAFAFAEAVDRLLWLLSQGAHADIEARGLDHWCISW